MNGKEHFIDIMNKTSKKSGFWHGNAHYESIPQLNEYFGVNGDYELGVKLNDTVSWCQPDFGQVWKHPENKPVFDIPLWREKAEKDGSFDSVTLKDVEEFPWPDTQYLDFTHTLQQIDRMVSDKMAVLSGTWSPFFHNMCDFFGMEDYFLSIYTNPEVVEAVTERICDFYLKANEKLFALAGGKIDAFFFGNDFGTQLDMLISPESFDKFVMPYFNRFTQSAKKAGYRVALHSCGSIWRVIPQLIESGVDILHPIQARAKNMEAERLASEYNGKIVFMGGLDTQEIMPFKSPQEVKDEVRRLKDIFGTNFILSPSHECILPIVPPANVEAMAEAALE